MAICIFLCVKLYLSIKMIHAVNVWLLILVPRFSSCEIKPSMLLSLNYTPLASNRIFLYLWLWTFFLGTMLQYNCQARWPIYCITHELMGSLELNYAHPPALSRDSIQGSLFMLIFAPLNGWWAENWTSCVGYPYQRFFKYFVWILRILWTSPISQWDGCDDKT